MLNGATAECRGGSFRYAFDPIQTPTWWSFQDEIHIRERWWHIKPGDVVLDVGADLGSYTLPALVAGAAFCYTWSLHWLEVFSINIAANGWQSKVCVNNYGLWSKDGWLLDLPNLSLPKFSTKQFNDSFRVYKMDDAAKYLKIEKADWLKIDIEGAEIEMLKGAKKVITNLKPKILIEYHQFKDSEIINKGRKILNRYGYQEVEIITNENCSSHALYEPRL